MAKKILIIEDDVFLGDVLLKKLKSSGYDAYLARDGAVGLNDMKTLSPDLVLLDIILPSLNGYEILEEKNKTPQLEKIPVIVISNSGQPVEIDRVLSLGVKDYMIKAQFDPEEVIAKVRLQLNEDRNEPETTSGSSVHRVITSLKDKKIVWVEDDIFLSEIIAKKLANQGCKLYHETNGEEAIRTVERELPDLVMLDILLSGIDGFEILKRLKANDKVKQIPVITLSNLGQKEDIDKALGLGAEKFLIKATVTLDEIIDEITRVIEQKSNAKRGVGVIENLKESV